MDDLLKTLALSRCYRMEHGELIAEDLGLTGEIAPGAGANLADSAGTGEIIDGKYRLLGLIGQGGMGAVYKAHHLALDKDVALKTFRSANMTNEMIERFQREAKAVAKLADKHVVQVFDFGVDELNRPYYTMELLQGESLAERLARSGPLSVSAAMPIFLQVCDGLSSAHKKGIVHRDLKPGNIFLNRQADGSEAVKVVDFGIAKLMDTRTMDAQKLTSTGSIFGSPLYMSPEQSMGDDIDERSDIYSFGCTLCEALTGRPPFVGATAFATISQHQSMAPPTLGQNAGGKSFPPWLENLLSRTLEKNCDKRVSTFAEVKRIIDFNSKNQKLDQIAAARPVRLNNDLSESGVQTGQSTTFSERLKNQALTGPLKIFALVFLLIGVAYTVVLGVNLYNQNHPRTITAGTDNSGSIADQHAHDMLGQPTEEYMDKLTKQSDLYKGDFKKNIYHDWLRGFNEKISAKTMQKIADSGIHNIDFHRCKFNNADFAILARAPVERIKLSGSNFNDIGAALLANCKSLIYIKAPETKLTAQGVAQLTRLKGMVFIDLSGSGINTPALTLLLKEFGRLEELRLSHCTGVMRSGPRLLSHSNIQRLEFRFDELEDNALPYFAQMPVLQTLDIAQSQVTGEGVYQLCHDSKTLKILNISRCHHVTPGEIKSLRKQFKNIEIEDEDHSGIDAVFERAK